MKKFLAFALLLVGIFSLAACGADTDQEDVDAARNYLIVSGLDSITGDLWLPAEGRYDTEVSWDSDQPDYIEVTDETRDRDGQTQVRLAVTRPDEETGHVDVNITATITKGDAETTREFPGSIRAIDMGDVYDNIADIYENASINDLVTIEGIVVTTFDGGYFIWDGEHVLGIYGGGGPEHGDELRVTGLYARYYTLYQLSDIENEEVLSTGNDSALPSEAIEFTDFYDLDLSDPLIHGKSFEFTGRLVEKDPHGYMNYYLEDIFSDKEILFYWWYAPGAEEKLEEFEGEIVTLSAVYYTNHATNGPMFNFDPEQDSIEIADLDLTTEDLFNLDFGDVDGQTHAIIDEDIELPTLGNAGTVFENWTSSHPDVIDHDGSFVAQPQETTVVTLTADASLEEYSDEATIYVTVCGEEPTDISDVHELEFGDYAFIQGVITAMSHNTLFMEDETGAISIFHGDLYEEVSVGDEVQMFGRYGEFNGLLQLSSLMMYEIVDEDQELPPIVNIDDVDLEDNDAMRPYQAHRISLNGMIVEEIDEDDWGTIEVTLRRASDDKEIIIRADNRIPNFDVIGPELLDLEVGDEINIDGMTVAWFHGAQLMPYTDGQFDVVD